MRITTIAVVIGLVLIAWVGVETPVAYGLDFMRLQNDTQVPNNLGIGAPDSSGVTQLPNGTYAAFINGGGSGSTIGPVLVRDYHNGTVAATAPFYVAMPSGNGTGNATELNGTSDNGNETSSDTNETQPQQQQQQPYNATDQLQNLLQQLPQIVQLNNGSIIVNGTVQSETDCSRTDLTQRKIHLRLQSRLSRRTERLEFAPIPSPKRRG